VETVLDIMPAISKVIALCCEAGSRAASRGQNMFRSVANLHRGEPNWLKI
jgi:hypothetical protein